MAASRVGSWGQVGSEQRLPALEQRHLDFLAPGRELRESQEGGAS